MKLAIRRLLATPGFTVAVIITLALGIGANSLTFGALHGLLIRPLPFTDADRLVWIYARGGDPNAQAGPVSTPEVQAVAERTTTVASIGVIGDKGLVVEGGGRFVQWHGLWVTPGLFEVLDIAPVLGRPLGTEHMGAGGPPAMMLGYERWTQDFGADPAIVGTVLSFADNKRYTVVGVLPPRLEFPLGRQPQSGNGSGFTPGIQDFWVLGQNSPREYPGGTLLARLKPGASLESVTAEARILATSLAAELPNRNDGRTFAPVSLRDQLLGPLAAALPLLQGFAALVLLIACGNLANLIMARAMSLELDAAIRTALGATRLRLTGALLAESVVLCVTGSALGLALAWSAQQWIRQIAAAYPAIAGRIDINGSVLLFTLTLCVLTTIGFALVPAAVRSRLSLSTLLGRNASRQTTRGSTVGRTSLVVVQVMLAIVLVTSAGLIRQSLDRLMSADTGYESSHVVVADVLLYVPGREVMSFYETLHERLRSLKGVEAVGLIQSTPLTGKWTFTEALEVEGQNPPGAARQVAGSFVAFDYFKAMGIPLLAGRTFTDGELLPGKRRAIILNDVAARMLFPGTNPVGTSVLLSGRPREVVGVVKGTRDVRLDVPAEAQWYEPGLVGGSQLMVRVSGDPDAFTGSLRRELLASDARLIVKSVEPLDRILAEHLFERRLTSQLLAGFAAIAFALAMTGLYGVMHVAFVQRKREFGLRAALGAQRGDLLWMVLFQGLSVAVLGIGTGIGVAIAGADVLRSVVYEISPTDPFTFAAVSAAVLLVSAAACFVPAWRAATTDPLETLRAD
jgi:predicted permease